MEPVHDLGVARHPKAKVSASARSRFPSPLQPMLPLRPRFLKELVVIPAAGELVVDGGDQLKVLRGETAQSLLPRLFPLMDGSRTLAELEKGGIL